VTVALHFPSSEDHEGCLRACLSLTPVSSTSPAMRQRTFLFFSLELARLAPSFPFFSSSGKQDKTPPPCAPPEMILFSEQKCTVPPPGIVSDYGVEIHMCWVLLLEDGE